MKKFSNLKVCLIGIIFTTAVTTSNAQPANDDCTTATLLTTGSSCSFINYSSVGATTSTGVPAPSCGGYSGGEVFFKAVVPASGSIRIEVANGIGINTQFAVYTGICGSLTQYSC